MNIFIHILIAGVFAGTSLAADLSAAGDSSSAHKTVEFIPRTGTFQLLESGVAGNDPVVFVWETDDSPGWLDPYPGTEAGYKDFAGWVRAHIDTEPRALLKRNRELWKKKGWSTRKYDLILSGQLGNIRPMNRLEGELLLLQLDRFGKPYKGEFLAFVLRKEGRLRIYGYGTAKGTMKPGMLRRRLEADIADKWEYYANLHNHPFQFSDKKSSTGELVPSGDINDGDVQYCLADAENNGLQRAAVTNGFHTIEITSKEFPLLGTVPDR